VPSYVPQTYPLQYISPPAAIGVLLESVSKTFVEAIVPESFDDAVAIALSEGAAGFVAGVASKAVSVIDGNKNNKDSALGIAANSGAFFFARGATRAIAELVGMSTLLVNIIGLSSALLFSELIKARSRSIEEQQTRVGKNKMIDLMKFKNEESKASSQTMLNIMKFRDVEVDINKRKASSQTMLNIMKFRDVEVDINKRKLIDDKRNVNVNKGAIWNGLPQRSLNLRKISSKFELNTATNTASKPPPPPDAYRGILNRKIGKIPLISTEAAGLSYFKKIEGIEVVSDVTKWFTFEALIPNSPDLRTSFIIGTVAGFTSQVVKETKIKNQVYTNDSIIKDTRPLRLLRSALEGSVQFWTYSYTGTLFKMIKTSMNNHDKLDINNVGTFITGLDLTHLSGLHFPLIQ
jgi:hypothetical protein